MMIIVFIGVFLNWLLSLLATPVGALLLIVFFIVNLPVMAYHMVWPEKRTELTDAEVPKFVTVVKLGDLSHRHINLTIKNRGDFATPQDIWVACDAVGSSAEGGMLLGTWVRITAFRASSQYNKNHSLVVPPHSTMEMHFDADSDPLLNATGASYLSSCTVGRDEEQALANRGYMDSHDKQGWWLTVTPFGYQHGLKVEE